MRIHFHEKKKNETKDTQFTEVHIFPFPNEEVKKK